MGYFSDLAITDSGWDRFDETNTPGVPVTAAGFVEDSFPATPATTCAQCGTEPIAPGRDLCSECQQWVDAHMHDGGAGEATR